MLVYIFQSSHNFDQLKKKKTKDAFLPGHSRSQASKICATTNRKVLNPKVKQYTEL